jgi:DNA polymerase-4
MVFCRPVAFNKLGCVPHFYETTFETDHHALGPLRSSLVALAEQVARRLRRHALSARTVEIKIRFADFKTITRSQTLSNATDTTHDLVGAAVALLKAHLSKNHRGVRSDFGQIW